MSIHSDRDASEPPVVEHPEWPSGTPGVVGDFEQLRIDLTKHRGLGILWKDRAEKAEAKIARVEALHSKTPAVGGEGWTCSAGCTWWPCATVAALLGTEES